MADISLKEQKLAAARKKLRKYQKKKAESGSKSSKSRESSPLELLNQGSGTSSRSSSVTDYSDSNSSKALYSDINNKLSDINSSDLHRESSYQHNSYQSSENFDSETQQNLALNSVPLETLKSEVNNSESPELNGSHDSNHEISKDPKISNYSEDRSSLSTPFSITNAVEPIDIPEKEDSVCSETAASVTTVINLKNSNYNQCVSEESSSPRSTSESLRQLSLQISGLVNDAETPDPNRQDLTILELEKRNSELASCLESEKQKSLEHASLVEELKRTVESQNLQIQGLQKMSMTESSGSEVNGLREQLQVHIQTIGILVAEKSELQTSLSHTRYSLEQKNGEVTELQGRLDACRERIKDMESSSQELKAQVTSLNSKVEADSQQILNLQNNNLKLSKMCDEMRATTAELTERLTVRTEENQKLNSELADVRRQYELAQVHLEQLKDHSKEDLRKQFEDLETSFSENQHQLRLVKASLEQADNEKQQLENQYKSYTSHLSNELDDLKQEFSVATKKLEELERIKADLEAELKAREKNPQLMDQIQALEHQKSLLTQEINEIKSIRNQMEEKCFSLARDNGQLSQLVVEQNEKLEALEAAFDRSNTNQVDTTKLLESMQSDKIAASRALSQNKQLKEQLEELQNGFVMMSNKKLELTEKLEKELHIKKNLYKEISQLGEELSSHKELLLTKQREVDSLKLVDSQRPGPRKIASGDAPEEGEKYVINGDLCKHHDTHECNSENGGMEEIDSKALHQTSDKSEGEGNQVGGAETRISKRHDHETEDLRGTTTNNSSEVSLRKAHEALEKRFAKCMQDLAAISDEKQNLEHVVQQLQLETDTVGDYITIYQFQRGVMKQEVQELKHELDLLRTEKQETLSKLLKLQKLIESLAEDKNLSKEVFLHGVSSIIKTNNTKDEANEENNSGENKTDESKTALKENVVDERKEKLSQNETVKQIMELIGEMETSSQIDISAFSKVHPCSHCSGKLLTI